MASFVLKVAPVLSVCCTALSGQGKLLGISYFILFQHLVFLQLSGSLTLLQETTSPFRKQDHAAIPLALEQNKGVGKAIIVMGDGEKAKQS